jgi:hypothetical protein
MFMDDKMSIFLWKRHKLVSILIVCLLQQKGLCDDLLSNNGKFNLTYNFEMCTLCWKYIHLLYVKKNKILYAHSISCTWNSLLNISEKHCEKLDEKYSSFHCEIWLSSILRNYYMLNVLGYFNHVCTLQLVAITWCLVYACALDFQLKTLPL